MFGGCLEGILEGKPTKNQHQNSQKLSTNFLQGTPKRVLPKDSHYFLLGPINPFKGRFGGVVWEVFGRYLGNFWRVFGGKTNQKQAQNKPKTFSTNFLIQGPKRVLPKDSPYFLLDPINPFKGTCFGLSLTLFETRNLQTTKNKTPQNFLLTF